MANHIMVMTLKLSKW